MQQLLKNLEKLIILPFANVNDINLYFEVSGVEGFPIILIHGVTISHILWKFQVPVLNPRFKVINLDLRNHGQSSTTDNEITMELLADDIKLLLDRLEITEAIIIGESMGCFISMEFALKFPEKTKALVLTCGANSDNSHVLAKMVLDDWIAHFQEGAEVFIKNEVPLIVCKKCRRVEGAKEMLDEYEKLLRSYPKNAIIQVFKGIQKFNVKNQLKQIKSPTLIIHGKKDKIIPLSFARQVHELIPNSQLEVLDACHFALVHDYPKFNEILLKFLEQVLKG